MAGKRKPKRKRSPVRPALGRNLAVRPGAGTHKPDAEKRASEKLRADIEEQRED
jgi:hypothetical protein